jgi:hypothetical protein
MESMTDKSPFDFHFTLGSLLRCVLFASMSFGSYAALYRSGHPLDGNIELPLMLMMFGGPGAAIGTLFGRTAVGIIVGLSCLLAMFVLRPMWP